MDNKKSLIIGGICLIMVLFCVDLFGGEDKYFEGTIIDKHYQASTRRTGTGVGVTSGGDLAVVSTTSGSPEKFIVIVQGKDEVLSVRVNITTYYKIKKDDRVEYCTRYGLLTNGVYKTHVTKIKETNDY